MKTGITQNFRGLRALVIHPDDANRVVLMRVLAKLGLVVQVLDPHESSRAAQCVCDVILIDADEAIEGWQPNSTLSDVPLIALIGTEAPSRLARVVRQGCSSHILKPIRNSGVFTALFLAVNEHARRQKAERDADTLRQRLAGRRIVTTAVLRLMKLHDLDQDEAYDRLRVAAMNRRMPIDDMAREQLAEPFRARGTLARPQAKTDDQTKKHANNRRPTP